MNEYSYLPIPFDVNAQFTILMNNGHFRKCTRRLNLDLANLWFTDCTHPMQQALVDQNKIVKWKIDELNPT